MKKVNLLLIAVPFVAGAITVAVRSGVLYREWAALTGGDPVLDCPATVELGEYEQGQQAVARFSVANRGGGELVIDQVRANNCACSGLEREVEGEFVRVETLRLGRGEQAELSTRIGVRGQANGPMRNLLTFRTNDPTRPKADIAVVITRVTGGVFTVPTSVVFADVPVGTGARQVVEVRDFAVRPRKIQRVSSSDPDRLIVRLLEAESPGPAEEQPAAGALIGRLEISARTHEVGPMDGTVLIHLDDASHPPDSVPVIGRVVPLVAIAPASVVLPRASGAGPLYFAQCACRSTTGKPLALELLEAPAGLSAVVIPVAGNPGLQMVRVEWKPDAAGPADTEQRVRFRARLGDHETTLDISVRLRRDVTP